MHSGVAPSVLLVDDDPSVLESVARALVSEGFAVRTARDAAEAVVLFTVAAPDIVLLDLNMPGESGWEAFEEMSHRAPLVPVVIVTARPGQFETARAACVAALVEKPVEIPTLVATMRRLLAENEATRLARLTHRAPFTRLVRPPATSAPASGTAIARPNPSGREKSKGSGNGSASPNAGRRGHERR